MYPHKSILLCFLWICAFLSSGSARAQDIFSTVAVNSNGSDAYVDIRNTTGGNLYFFTDPSPAQARMGRVSGGSEFPWPSTGNFTPDPQNLQQNRLYSGEYLRVYPKTLPPGSEIQVEFSYSPVGPHYHFRVSVVAGARVDSIFNLDPIQSTASTVRWRVTFDQPISGVTAANFALESGIPGVSITSVTPDTAQPSANWTVTASTGTTTGSIGLKWVGHQTETPPVPNPYVTQFPYAFGDSIFFVQDLPTAPILLLPNTTTTLAVVANRRSGQELFYRWYVTPPGGTTPVAISGARSASYTPPAYTPGTYQYFCSVFGSPDQEFTNFLHSQTATVLVRNVPTVTNPFFENVTNSSARLYGTVTADGGFPLSRRGIVYAQTSVNSNPVIGGTGVMTADDPQVNLGTFSRTVTGLNAATSYSFAAFAMNSQGTVYTQVVTFQTNPAPGGGSLIVTTAVDEDNGTSDPGMGAGTSLREAVAYANALGGDQTITFSPNLFANGPVTIALSPALSSIQLANLTGTTTIDGPGASQLTIQGNGAFRLFRKDDGGARLNGMTFTNGANGDGGVIRSYGSLYVNDCVFTNNNVGFSRGGAIYNGNNGYFSRCTFVGNSATQETGRGGAIANEGSAWVMNCTFSGNSAAQGGAIANIFSSSFVYAINSTITNNSASTDGGGFITANPDRLFVRNSIVSGNTAPTNPNIGGSPNPAFLLSSLIDADPAAIFATGLLANNGGSTPTIALKAGGPAINAGTNSLAVDNNFAPLTTDQTGRTRVINTTVDIGAYEAPALPTVGPSTVSDITATSATLGGNVTSDGSGTISKRGILYALTSANSNPTIGGPGVIEVDASGTTSSFTVPVGGLTALAGYSFTSFVTNETGTVYAPVQTFQTTESPSLVVQMANDTLNGYDGQTSLREALAYAQSLGGARTITFSPAMAGQTITLTAANGNADSWDTNSALSVTGNITIAGLTTSPGVTLAVGPTAALRHFVVRSGASLTLSNLTLAGGKPQFIDFLYDRGGAISAFGNLTARNCTFSGNSSPSEGGAIQNWAGAAGFVLENCTFSGNSAGNQGGAFSANGAQATLSHLTMTNNTAPNSAVVLWGTQAAMVNTILVGNSNDTVLTGNGGTFSALSRNNLLGASSATGVTGGSNGNQLGVSAASLLLGSLGNNGGPTATVPLLPGSPAIDAGVTIAGLTTDQRGTTRPQANAPDIGAFELVWTQAAAIPIISPLGGTYESSAQISIANTSVGSTVRYTLDGSTPSSSNGQIYGAQFILTQNTTVKAIASGRGWLPSPVASVGYTVLDPLPYWRNLQGLAGDGSQDLANPSGDGIANLLKYAFKLAQRTGDLTKANYQILTANGTAGLPLITRDAQGRLTIAFVRRKASTNPGISYSVETGSDLAILQPLDLSAAIVVSIDETWERVTVTDPAVTPNRFGRVRVSVP